MNVQKEALRDASEYALAQVFYGEGAGNRRKLIATTVASKKAKSPMYRQTFELALSRQDMAKHVSKARRQRRRRDLFTTVNKNTRNAVSGRYTGLNALVIVVGGAAYMAHRSGYDKQIYAKIKLKANKVRARHSNKTVEEVKPVEAPKAVPDMDATPMRIPSSRISMENAEGVRLV